MGQDFVSSDKADALSIAIVRGDSFEFFNFGSTIRGEDKKPTKQSVYEIGSVTKLFTSLLLAHAVQEGRIGLQDDIRRYLPGEYRNLSFGGLPIRVIDLADTTSALPDNLPNFKEVTANVPQERKAFVLADTLARYSQDDMLRDLHSVSLDGEPGIQPRHSNLAAELLGYILTRLYGKSFPELLQAKIQYPLGMSNGVRADDLKLTVRGFDSDHKAMPATDQSAVLAAGGLRYNPQDMAQFLKAELSNTDPAIQLSQRPAIGQVERGAIGFSWQITRNVEGALRLNTSGGTSGGASYVEIYPERGYGVVLLANRSGETEGLLYGLADALFAVVEGTPGLDKLRNVLIKTRYVRVENTIARVRHRFPYLSLSEAYVNNWGGGLLDTEPKSALALFQYNARQWPQSSDAFDSLGDGYARNGDLSRAAKAYKTALKLNSANKEASESLKSLVGRLPTR